MLRYWRWHRRWWAALGQGRLRLRHRRQTPGDRRRASRRGCGRRPVPEWIVVVVILVLSPCWWGNRRQRRRTAGSVHGRPAGRLLRRSWRHSARSRWGKRWDAMWDDGRAANGARVQARLAGVRLEGVLVRVARRNVSVVVALVVRLVIELPDGQLGAVRWCGCRRRRWRQTGR